MYNPDKPFELRNIKKNPSGYQVQYIVNGKSHSVLVKDLEKAKKVRDQMEKKLKIATPSTAYRYRSPTEKMSCIPGTNKPMPTGVTLRVYQHQGSESYDVQVRWRDHTGHGRIKTFYGCSSTTYSVKKLREAYKLAIKFRQAYEKAVSNGTLEQLDPSSFNRNRKKKSVAEKVKSNPILRKKLRHKPRKRR